MSTEIPCTPGGSSRWTQRTAIDGRDYVLTFDWSQRVGRWSLTLADQDGSPIRSGMLLVSDWPLLRGLIDARAPSGALLVVDTQARGADPGWLDLGGRFRLVYFTAAEIAAAAAA